MYLLGSMKKEAFKNLQKNMPDKMAAEQFKIFTQTKGPPSGLLSTDSSPGS